VLKNRAPALEIDALVYAETREMLDLHPAIAQVHVVRRDWKDSGTVARLVAEWRLLSMLRSRGYELVIHLSEHPRGAWLARSLGARYAVAPDFARKPPLWKKSFTHLVPLPPHARRHRVEINLDALRRIGIQPGEDERKLVLVPGEDAERGVERLLAAQGLGAALRVLARHENVLALVFTRLNANAPERVEIDFHPVAPCVGWERNEVREALLPERRLSREVGRHGIARPERASEPRTARMLGKMDHELVASRSQHGEEPPLCDQARDRSRIFPVAPHHVDLRDRRVQVEHFASLGIDKGVDLEGWRAVLEDREHRRGHENVAMVAQLDHERAPQAGNVDRVARAVIHAAHDSR